VYPESADPNILIFSPSHEPESWVQETKGVLQVGLTAFDPILHIDVNGHLIDFDQDTQIQVEIPYELKSRQTDFQITTFTRVGTMQKRFTIHYGVKPVPKRPALMVVAILGTTTVDNLTNVPEGTDKIAATKTVLTVVPQYELRIGEDTSLKLQGILLRERYGDETWQNLETAYTQLAIDWEERKTFFGTLTAIVGWNSVKTNNENFIGENDILTETFVAGSIKRQPDKEKRWEIRLEYKNKNSAVQAADVDNETDATAVTLEGKIKWPLFGFSQNARLNYTLNDAVGQYQDFTTSSLGYTLSHKIGDLSPSLGYTYTAKKMNRHNPAFDVTPAYNAGQTAIKLKYQLFKRSSISLGVKAKTQISNLATSTYTSNSATLDWTQIF
jgi:hypothetical protein